jgi:RNA 3'-terminal phosphate cyclase (ATP)
MNGQIRVNIRGGTNVWQSPSYEYIIHVLLPTLRKIGLPPISASLERRGWSTGHTTVGSVNFDITPLGPGQTLPAFELCDRGDICAVAAKILAPTACRTTLESEIRTRLGDTLGNVDVDVEFSDSRDPKRLYLLLVATSANGYRLGSDLLYDLRIKNLQDTARLLVKRVVAQLLSEVEHGGCVDEFMRDQLVVFQSLAAGRCEIDVGRSEDGKYILPSLHAKTAFWVSNELLGVEFDQNGIGDGIGYAVANEEGDGIGKLTQDVDTLVISH